MGVYCKHMARKAREKSESGMYHVVLKGNDKLLFAEDDDYRRFLTLLASAAERDFVEVYGYCLFCETAHLVLKEGLRPIGETLKRLVSAYAVQCNEKYERHGKLFHDRYISETIETDEDLLDAVRFVSRLPLDAGETLAYAYSSFNNYMQKKGLRSDALVLLTDGSLVRFAEEMEKPPVRAFATGEKRQTLTDAEVAARIKRRTHFMTVEEAERITLPMLGGLAYALRQEGASIRQLSRVLQVSKGTVEKALKIYAV